MRLRDLAHVSGVDRVVVTETVAPLPLEEAHRVLDEAILGKLEGHERGWFE